MNATAPTLNTSSATAGKALARTVAGALTAVTLIGACAIPAAAASVTPTAVPAPTVSIAAVAPVQVAANRARPVAPSQGRGGSYRDLKGVTYSNGASTSQYHVYAGHLNGKTPHGIIVHLHGDGALEYNRPEWTTVPKYLELARKHNLMLVVPKTPDRVGSITWWEGNASGRYAADLFSHLSTTYNVDLNRVYWTGYSGGAETITYKLLDAYANRWSGGAAVIVGGGGASTWRNPTVKLPTKLKTDFPMHWVAGADDTPVRGGSSGSFDAVKAAKNGQAYFKNQGMATSLTIKPGLDHYEIAAHGPAKLAQILQGR